MNAEVLEEITHLEYEARRTLAGWGTVPVFVSFFFVFFGGEEARAREG